MPYDAAPAAALLARAAKTGEQLEALPEAVRPSNLAEGYRLQDAFIAATGEPAGGWKIGLGTVTQMRGAKLSAPLAGRILASRFHKSGDTIRLPNAAPVTVEFEIAFVLGRDVAPDDLVLEPLEAISEVRTTFELVLSRFVDRRAVGWPSFAGDSVGFEALVIGETLDPQAMPEVWSSVVISVDGQEMARGLSGDDCTDPPTAFSHLMMNARERGHTLRKGEICTLGIVGKPFDVTGDVRIEAAWNGGRLACALQRP
jgi:2-keto-4-pentenoate hydratase